MMKSLYGRIKPVFAMCKTVGGGDSTSAVIDLQGFTSCYLAITSGVFNLTSTNKVTLTVLESVDNTTYGTVADADMEGIEAAGVHRVWDASASDASVITNIAYRGVKRYLKLTFVEGGTVSLPMAVVAVCGDSHNKPSID